MKIAVISLGCPKNLTDTEAMLGKFASAGHVITNSIRGADLLVINTCAFIKPAINEALREIRKAVSLKKKGIIKQVAVAGCLPARMKFDRSIPVECLEGVDAVIDSLGLFDWKAPRIKATPGHYSYIKIADGCDNRCSYCTVPLIRGPYRSRRMKDILTEAEALARTGTRELILVAQDTTYYGSDIYGKPSLAKLLRKLCRIKRLKWIRLMYAHPAHVTDELIRTMAEEERIVKYIDLPLQHSCDKMLRLMKRRTSGEKIASIIRKIRRSMPDAALRSTFIVGFPGESEREYRKLLGFIKKERFDRLGIFTYFAESGTPAAKMRGQVPEGTKKSRYHRAMLLQNRISAERNRKEVGKVIDVIIDRVNGRNLKGRSGADAPEIDGSVSIKLPAGSKIKVFPGEVVKARITKSSAYDLFGKLVT